MQGDPRPDAVSAGASSVAALSDLLRRRLADQGAPERAAGERRYLHSTLTHVGVGVPALRRTTRELLREHPLDVPARLALVDELWRSDVYELRRAAVEVLVRSAGELDHRHLVVVEHMLRGAQTWALADPLATDVAGVIATSDPRVRATFDRWIIDDALWVRRAALLAWLPVLRADPAQFHGFARHADRVLDEREFFVRKAIGWVLREVGKRAPGAVVEWLEPRTARASGVTMREAVRYLPEADAARLMAAYRSRR